MNWSAASGTGVQSYQLRVTSGHMVNYSYLLVNHTSREAVLVDPAWDPVQITEQVQLLEVQVRAILITHAHFDHVHLAAPLARHYQVPVYMSSVAAAKLKQPIPSLHSFATDCTLSLAGMQLTALLTPGHSTGSACYLSQAHLYTGDTLFIEGCGTCAGGEPACRQLYDSLQKLKQLVPPQVLVCAGHCFSERRVAPFGEVCRSNVYLQFSSYEQFRDYRLRPRQHAQKAYT